MPLLAGKSVVISANEGVNVFEDKNFLAHAPYDFLKITPAHLELLKSLDIDSDEPWVTRKLVIGGEALYPGQFNHFYNEDIEVEVINEYGPTEATVGCIVFNFKTVKDHHKIQNGILIGKPIDNTSIYIIDKANNPMPLGAAGEICIAGKGLAQGYINRDDLNAEKFIDHSFVDGVVTRMYKTGDYGRWLADGNIEYIGRQDDQVKIRGYRVELGEIENTILQSGMVNQASLIVKSDKENNKRLIAYIVCKDGIDTTQVKEYCKEILPVYMQPSLWVAVDSMPLTISGKIDKKALPEPVDALPLNEVETQGQLTELQEVITEIWKNLLEIDTVGIHDNFFAMGGDSLLGVRVVAAIRKKLFIDIEINSIFDHSTIALLSSFIEGKNESATTPAIMATVRPQQIPLSFAQERLWFINQLEGSTQYHISTVLQLNGILNVKALQYAFKSVIKRHEVLRTVIKTDDGKPYQFINTPDEFHLHTMPISADDNNEEHLHQLVSKLVNRPFNFEEDYMVRVQLLQLASEEHLLVITFHHIAFDGISNTIFIKEFIALYENFIANRPPGLQPLHVQYADYAIWQRFYLTGDVLKEKLNFWKENLAGLVPLELPTDYTRPSLQSFEGRVVPFSFDKQLLRGLKQLSTKEDVTLFMTALAAFYVLLSKYSAQHDISIGTPVGNRSQHEIEQLIGFFTNTIVLRANVDDSQSFTRFLKSVKEQSLLAFQHQDVPFEKVVDAVLNVRDVSRSPLFQVMFVFQNEAVSEPTFIGEVKITPKNHPHQTSKFDLTFFLKESDNSIEGFVEYATGLFKEDTILRMINHFINLLNALVSNPTQKISDISLVSNKEKDELLHMGRGDVLDIITNQTVISLFEEQVKINPSATAIVYNNSTVSYRELNARANILAHHLVSIGVLPQMLVPICVDEGIDMMVGLLGILKAGAAYVPIEPNFPTQRISFIVKDTEAKFIFCNTASLNKLNGLANIEAIKIDELSGLNYDYESSNPALTISSKQLAYVIYTSGSTGTPKGVMIEHGNLVNYLLNTKAHYINEGNIGAGSYVHLSYTFDASLTAIFMPLIAGKSMVIASRQYANVFEDPGFQQNAPYDFIKATPAHLPLLFNCFKNEQGTVATRKIVVGGEALLLSQCNYLITEAPEVEIINEYGPTEATVGCSTFSFIPSQIDNKVRSISIGRPIDNTRLYIVNEGLQLVPVGIPGQICLSGDGLARGYLNRPELTAEKFIPNPFSIEEGTRLYKTGDVGRWLSDGSVEYLGRIDNQVKINGYRIELGEIENVLLQSGLVTQAVVLVSHNNMGNKQLVGYVVAGDVFNKEAIIDYLLSRLPEYMVPILWINLAAIPLNANGKIDKKALQLSLSQENNNEIIALPRNEAEATLVAIWQQLLGVKQPGIFSTFFELGGHSLLVMRLISAIRKDFNVQIGIKEIFTHSTIARMATLISTIKVEETLLPAIISIDPKPANIPLSFSQERLWFIDKLEGSLQYHIPASIQLKGDLNIAALQKAFYQVIERHQVLRTILVEKEDEPYQVIQGQQDWQLQYKEDSTLNITGVQRFILAEVNRPFDLAKDYLMRAGIIKQANHEHTLWVVMHHIASDGWSAPILIKEVSTFYNAFVKGEEIVLPPMPIQYVDYSIWQRTYFINQVYDKKLAYWQQKLQEPSPLELPLDFNRPAFLSGKGNQKTFLIDRELAQRLQQISLANDSTLFMTLLTAFKVLLFRYTDRQDIIVGSPVANRTQPEVENMIGFFVNTLALRSSLQADISFTDLLKQVKNTTLEAYENQEVPFEKIVESVVKERDMSRSPLFQAMFVLQNASDAENLQLDGLTTIPQTIEQNTAKFELTFNLSETTNGIEGSAEYSTDLFKHERVEGMTAHFIQLLRSIVHNPDLEIINLPMLSKAEENKLLVESKNTIEDFHTTKTWVTLFEEQATKTPDATAAVYDTESYTYQQLNEYANQVAQYLVTKGVTAETLVPVCLERSIEMIVSILAINKAGGAYVPIDPSNPAERIRYILKDTAAKIIISTTEIASKWNAATSDNEVDAYHTVIASANVELVTMDKLQTQIANQPTTDLLQVANGNNLAYVIYTSGSTGLPKGVMIENRNVINLTLHQVKEFGITAEEKILQFSNYAFDASVEQYMLAFATGATLVLVPQHLLADQNGLLELIEREGVTHFHATPSFIDTIQPAKYGSLKRVIAGGEQCSQALAESWGKHVDFYNEYGPTETTVTIIEHKYAYDNTQNVLPIGKPFANTAVYIVDKKGNLLPNGITGEIWIAGASVARGYLNRPELTAEKFIADPYCNNPAQRLYKTGDFGRRLPDNNLEYLGRIDEQVKIRGYRIELGEIENTLLQSDLVQQVVVVAASQTIGGMPQLAGYVVPRGVFNAEELSNYLLSRLPAYMVPSRWIAVDKIPLTINGKVDKKALPSPFDDNFSDKSYEAPRNGTEIVLATIWQDLLNIKSPGIHQNFFHSGGHSLLAIRLLGAIRRQFNIAVSIKDIFSQPTIAGLSGLINKSTNRVALPPIEIVEPKPDHIPLSFSQERLYFIDRFEGTTQYHLPLAMHIKGQLNTDALDTALRTLVVRHQILRSVVREENGTPYQTINEATGWKLEQVDATDFNDDEVQEYLRLETGRAFNLSVDYMLRASLLSLKNNEFILLLVVHHIAVDGWSMPILMKEFETLYNSYNIPINLKANTLQYADFAIWQRKHFTGNYLQQKINYWKQKLEGYTPIEMPTDFTRPALLSGKGAETHFFIQQNIIAGLKNIGAETDATLNMLLLSAFKVLLFRYSSQQDICVGIPVANRDQPDLENMVGFFVNTLVIRSGVKANMSFTQLLQQVKQTSLEAFENQDLPFEKVVENVVKTRDQSRTPIFQVMFALQNTSDEQSIQLNETELSLLNVHNQGAKFEMTVNLVPTAAGIKGTVEYSTDLFKQERIDAMMVHYVELMKSIVSKPQAPIVSLAMLTHIEEDVLLNTFNHPIKIQEGPQTFIGLFNASVANNANAIALVDGEVSMTYADLDEKTGKLAAYLISKGVTIKSLVPVCMERSLDLVIAILSIIKAGAAYVPIDLGYPEQRKAYMLQDTGAKFVITNKNNVDAIPVDNAYEVIVIENAYADADQLDSRIAVNIKPNNLAYVIYTSGSTGKPKGVMIEHHSLVNLIGWHIEAYKVTAKSQSTAMAGIAFDAFAWELFPYLAAGSTIHIFGLSQTITNQNLINYFKANGITHSFLATALVPDFVSQTRNKLPQLTHLLTGGDKLTAIDLKDVTYQLINNYGPTENTVVATSYLLSKATAQQVPSIGSPIKNTRLYIVNEANGLMPVGVPGEICLGGVQVARGYWNNATLTRQKFIKNPYDHTPFNTLYKTGDKGRWMPDGNIEYMGRIDDQVKLRGYRIELGEIEHEIIQSKLIKQAIVVLKEYSPVEKRLVGYVVTHNDFNPIELKAFLLNRLPEYMVPVHWVTLEKLPLTVNGKIDKAALPAVELDELSSVAFVAPETEIEVLLTEIWKELLGLSEIGVHDNFFELGGHSLLALRLIANIQSKLGIDLAVKEVFEFSTIAELAKFLEVKTAGVTNNVTDEYNEMVI